MKKLLTTMSLVLGLAALSYAGTPQDNTLPGQNPYSNAEIIGSTSAANTTSNLSVTLAPGTVWNGASVSCRNCFTNFMVQIPTYTVISLLDLTTGTTFYSINGLGLASSGVNTLSIPRDHLGPLCTTAGDSTQINVVNTNGTPSNPQVVNYEGYTVCGTQNQGGVMK